jgi:hypothetical protein
MPRVAKTPDPADCRRDEARDRRGHHRRELGRDVVAMLQFLLDAQKGRLGTRDLCFVADVRESELARQPIMQSASETFARRVRRSTSFGQE